MNELFIGVLMFGLTMPAVPAKPAAQAQLTTRQKWKLADRLMMESVQLEQEAQNRETRFPRERRSNDTTTYSTTQGYLNAIHSAGSVAGKPTPRGRELRAQAVEKRLEAEAIYRKLKWKRPR